MHQAFFTKQRAATPGHTRRGEIEHPECPIEQSVRGRDDAAKAHLARFAGEQRAAHDGTTLLADDHGLRVLARSEAALTRAVQRLARRFAGRIVLRAPAVRYVPGNPVLEPYMMLAVIGPDIHLGLVRKDMTRRGGHVVEAAARSDGTFRLEAEAPLAQLLGYSSWLSALSDNDVPQSSAWFSRYRPVDDGGPRAA
jgi:hypothetical protein